jgi:RNA polymerase sigma factor (sigma-70 family)
VTAPLVDHLFRHQSGRMIARLVRLLGVQRLPLAEDAVQDALLRALEAWKFGRLPREPEAWLYACARNRALDLLRRQAAFDRLAPQLARTLEEEPPEGPQAPGLVADDELRLMFSCCAPQLPGQSQVAVILKYLCGFSVEEIAQALLTSQAAVEKALYRARQALLEAGPLFEVREEGPVRARLPSVQHAIYLLFSEGYHGAHEQPVREDLCLEATRLCHLLTGIPAAATPDTQAMLALFCLLAARLPGRLSEEGELLLLEEQDRTRWDRALIAEGLRRLDLSASGEALTSLHLEAAIAAQHARASSFEETDWRAIVQLYDFLLRLKPTPVIALNRAIAVGMAEGPQAGLAALAAIEGKERLARYPFLPAAFAEFERRAGRAAEARAHLARALSLARSSAEEAQLRRRFR